MTETKFDFKKALEKLTEINNWFQSSDLDLDEGLKKLKEGRELITQCNKRIKEVENEFVKIKAEFAKEEDIDLDELLGEMY
ncbi:MAG: exodeoxyribonuclease VII small subunit [Patescibacteria group bacterium]